jgi:hypothetical protein
MLALLLAIIILVGCGRDKGSYEIEGTFLDACSLQPVQRAKGVIYVYDVDSIQVNEQGYFHEEASWDVELGWMLKPREYVDLETQLFDNNAQRSFYTAFTMEKGYSNMGNILLNTQLAIPMRFMGDTTTCSKCKWEIFVRQENAWRIWSHQNKINLVNVPNIIIELTNDTPLEWNIIDDRPQNPVMLTVIEIDSAQVRSTKLTMDISDQINRCGLSDTVTINL